MKNIKKFVVFILVTLVFLTSLKTDVMAGTKFTLNAPTAPAGGFKSGDILKFTINVDTQGESVTSTQVGISYQSEFLQYQNLEKGNTFDSVTSQPDGTDKLILKGTSSAGFKGTGVYTYVNLKIIATSPGSAQLCSLYNPATSPTPTTGYVSSPTPTTPYSVSPAPTNAPQNLPQTGSFDYLGPLGLAGIIMISFKIILDIKEKIG